MFEVVFRRQVDPKAEIQRGISPYCAMNGNPILYNDPNGDVIPAIAVAAIIGAGVGGATYGINYAVTGNGSWGGFIGSVAFGAVSGAVSFGVGSAFGGAGSVGLEIGRAGAHALTGGAFSSAQGGNFWHGAAAGAIGSGIGSGLGATGLKGASLDWAQWGGGGLGDGLGSVVAGGNFFDGLRQGLITGGLNHAAHQFTNPTMGPGRPSGVGLSVEHHGFGIGEAFASSSLLSGYSSNGVSLGQRLGLQTNFKNLKVYNLYRSNRTLNGNQYISGSKFNASVKVFNRVSTGLTLASGLYDVTQGVAYSDSRYFAKAAVSTATSFIPYAGPFVSYYFSTRPIKFYNQSVYSPSANEGSFVCFVAGTKVWSDEGLINIEDLIVRDSVYSYNMGELNVEPKPIMNTSVNCTDHLLVLTLAHGGTIRCTEEHPFYVEGKGWIEAGNLTANMRLKTYEGEMLLKEIQYLEKDILVYNIQVGDNANYYITKDKILVHNKSEYEDID